MAVNNDISLLGILGLSTTLILAGIGGVSYVTAYSAGADQNRADVAKLTKNMADMTKELRTSFADISKALEQNLVYQDRVVSIASRVGGTETRNATQDDRIASLESRVGIVESQMQSLAPSFIPAPGRRK